jgi:hypothetical protein
VPLFVSPPGCSTESLVLIGALDDHKQFMAVARGLCLQARSAPSPRRFPPHQSPIRTMPPSASPAPAPPPVAKEQRRPWAQRQDKRLLNSSLHTGDRLGSRGTATAVVASPSLAKPARGPAVKVSASMPILCLALSPLGHHSVPGGAKVLPPTMCTCKQRRECVLAANVAECRSDEPPLHSSTRFRPLPLAPCTRCPIVHPVLHAAHVLIPLPLPGPAQRDPRGDQRPPAPPSYRCQGARGILPGSGGDGVTPSLVAPGA